MVGIKHHTKTALPSKIPPESYDEEHDIDDASITLAKLSGHDKAAHDSLGIDAATLGGSTKAQVQSHAPATHGNETHSSVFLTTESDPTVDGKISSHTGNANAHHTPPTMETIVDGTTYKKYTTTEQSKLAGVEANANNYVHPSTGTCPQDPKTHSHALADLSEKSHTSLTDKGTNTHATIDTHLSSTANPHSVTKTQVSLGNVTDDAQIAKSIGTTKGDIIAFSTSATPARLAIGSNTQVLTADSAEATGIKWATPTGGSGTPDCSYYRRTGTTRERWYTVPTTATAMTVSTALTANRIYAHPFIVPKTITLDRIAVNVTTLVASGKLRLGIYSDSNSEPGSRVLDAGEVDTSTTGVKTLTINQQLTAGLYWLAAASNSATHAFRVPAIAATINVCGVANTLPTAVMTHYYASFTYAVLPATFPTVTEGTTLVYPAIFVRLSA